MVLFGVAANCSAFRVTLGRPLPGAIVRGSAEVAVSFSARVDVEAARLTATLTSERLGTVTDVSDRFSLAARSATATLSGLPPGNQLLSVRVDPSGNGGIGADSVRFYVAEPVAVPAAQALIAAATGGSLQVTDPTSTIFGATLEIPPGALAQDTLVTLAGGVMEARPSPANTTPVSPSLSIGPEGTTLAVPARLRLPWTNRQLRDARAADAGFLAVGLLDPATSGWEELSLLAVDPLARELEASLPRFSTVRLVSASRSLFPGDDCAGGVLVPTQRQALDCILDEWGPALEASLGGSPATVEQLAAALGSPAGAALLDELRWMLTARRLAGSFADGDFVEPARAASALVRAGTLPRGAAVPPWIAGYVAAIELFENTAADVEERDTLNTWIHWYRLWRSATPGPNGIGAYGHLVTGHADFVADCRAGLGLGPCSDPSPGGYALHMPGSGWILPLAFSRAAIDEDSVLDLAERFHAAVSVGGRRPEAEQELRARLIALLTGPPEAGAASASFSVAPGELGQATFAASFSAAASTPSAAGSGLVAHRWEFGDGGSFESPGNAAAHGFTRPGDWPVALEVEDDTGAVARFERLVTVTAGPPGNQPPVPQASWQTDATSSSTVQLDATGSQDADGAIAACVWAFGDGSLGWGCDVSHTYAGTGPFTVTLTVLDDQMREASQTFVVELPAPTLARFGDGRLTGDDGPDRSPSVADPTVVWQCHDGQDPEICRWDGGAITQLTQNTFFDYCPVVSGETLAWMNSRFELVVSDEVGTTVLDLLPVGYCAFSDDLRSFDVDQGQVVYLCRPEGSGLDTALCLWDGSSTTEIVPPSPNRARAPRISAGQVVWMCSDGNDFEICLWDGSEVTQLTDNDVTDAFPEIDGARIVWQCGAAGESPDGICLREAGITRQISDQAGTHLQMAGPAGSPAARIVWQAETSPGSGLVELYLWDGAATHRLTSDATPGSAHPAPSASGEGLAWVCGDSAESDICIGTLP